MPSSVSKSGQRSDTIAASSAASVILRQTDRVSRWHAWLLAPTGTTRERVKRHHDASPFPRSRPTGQTEQITQIDYKKAA
jgi:hypothetical protein